MSCSLRPVRTLIPLLPLLGLTAFAAGAQEPAPAFARDDATIAQGRTLFLQLCASCHVLDRDGIGPPLGGITRLLSPTELKQQLRNSAAVIAAGDLRANALFRRYKVPMPSFDTLSDGQIEAVLAFIDRESEAAKLTPLAVNLTAGTDPVARLIPPVEKSRLVIELEDYVRIPLAPNRRPDKGIATVRSSPQHDGSFYISDQMGVIYRVHDRQVAVYLDIRGRLPDFAFEPGIGTGLGSFAFHPDFMNNGLLYTTHAEPDHGQPAINDDNYENVTLPNFITPTLHWVVTEWQMSGRDGDDRVEKRREVLRIKTPSTAHGCQDLAFVPVSDRNDPDYGLLYLGVGEGGSVNMKMPQLADHPKSVLGSVIRIDPRGRNGSNGQYGIPADNPFVGNSDPKVKREIWALGFRNPHRMSWDLSYGQRRLLVADIGEANVEEVNLIEKGGHYGWNRIEGTTYIDVLRDAKVVRAATAGELAGYKLPLGMFDHTDGRAISGGFVYLGPIPALQHKYVFGDIVSGRLFFMHLDRDLQDRKVYELNIVRDGLATSVGALTNTKRAHLRIGYDEVTREMFIMTKEDGLVRRITKAYER